MPFPFPQRDAEPDDLDRLLAEARWDEPTPEAIDRLRDQWRGHMVRRVRHRRRLALVAATVLAAVGLAVFEYCDSVTLRRASEQVALAPVPQAVPSNAPPEPRTMAEQPPAVPQAGTTRASRPPNAYEIALRASYRRRRSCEQPPVADDALQTAETASPSVPTTPEPDRAQRQLVAQREFLTDLLSRGDARSVEVFLEHVDDARSLVLASASLADVSNPPVEALFRCLRSPQASRRMTAAVLLGRLDRPNVSQELIAMAVRGVRRQEAMIALLASSEPTARRFLADAARDPNLSTALGCAKQRIQTTFPRSS